MEPLTLAALIGALATIVVSIITRANWSDEVKRVVAIVTVIVAVIIGLLVYGFPNQWETVAAALGIAVGVAQTVFTILKPTGIFDWIQWETTPKGRYAKTSQVENSHPIDDYDKLFKGLKD